MSNSIEKTRFDGPRGGNILEFYSREFKPEPSPFEMFRQHVSQWFFASRMLRAFEATALAHKPSEQDLSSHQIACAALITFGAFASSFAKNHKDEVELEKVGLKVDDIEAETRLLRDNFKMFHDDTMSQEEAEKVLKEAFP